MILALRLDARTLGSVVSGTLGREVEALAQLTGRFWWIRRLDRNAFRVTGGVVSASVVRAAWHRANDACRICGVGRITVQGVVAWLHSGCLIGPVIMSDRLQIGGPPLSFAYVSIVRNCLHGNRLGVLLSTVVPAGSACVRARTVAWLVCGGLGAVGVCSILRCLFKLKRRVDR